MQEKYLFSEIESKWQKYWVENKAYKTEEESPKPKYYDKEDDYRSNKGK